MSIYLAVHTTGKEVCLISHSSLDAILLLSLLSVPTTVIQTGHASLYPKEKFAIICITLSTCTHHVHESKMTYSVCI